MRLSQVCLEDEIVYTIGAYQKWNLREISHPEIHFLLKEANGRLAPHSVKSQFAATTNIQVLP
jgi:hypothetical protein